MTIDRVGEAGGGQLVCDLVWSVGGDQRVAEVLAQHLGVVRRVGGDDAVDVGLRGGAHQVHNGDRGAGPGAGGGRRPQGGWVVEVVEQAVRHHRAVAAVGQLVGRQEHPLEPDPGRQPLAVDPALGQLEHLVGAVDPRDRPAGAGAGHAHGDVAGPAAQVEQRARAARQLREPGRHLVGEALVAFAEVGLGVGEGLVGVVHQLGLGRSGQGSGRVRGGGHAPVPTRPQGERAFT